MPSLNDPKSQKLDTNVRTILNQRLKQVRSWRLFRYPEQQDKGKPPTVVSFDRSPEPGGLGGAALELAARASLLTESAEYSPVDAIVLVGTLGRAYLIPYDETFLVLVASDAIGNVCYHCRWDQTFEFGLLPHIRDAQLELPPHSQEAHLKEAAASYEVSFEPQLAESLERQPAPPAPGAQKNGGGAGSVAEELKQDIPYNRLLLIPPDKDRSGRLENRDSSRWRDRIVNLLEASVKFMRQLLAPRENIGELREVIVSRESFRKQPDAHLVVIVKSALKTSRNHWACVVTRERLGRSLFAMRRHFQSVPDDPGCPSLIEILNNWHTAPELNDLDGTYCSGVFARGEQLWVSDEAPLTGILEVEIPDVAGTLVDFVARSPLGEGSAGRWPVRDISIELLSEAEDLAGRKVTLLVPLKADLWWVVSTEGPVEFVKPLILSCARRLRAVWHGPEEAFSDRPLEAAVSIRAHAHGLHPPGHTETSGPRAREFDATAGYLGKIAHRFRMMAHVLSSRGFPSIKGAARVGSGEMLLHCNENGSGAAEIEGTLYLPDLSALQPPLPPLGGLIELLASVDIFASVGFRSVTIAGQEHSFRPGAAKLVEVLFDLWTRGHLPIATKEWRKRAALADNVRPIDQFKPRMEFWREFIVPVKDQRGVYTLNLKPFAEYRRLQAEGAAQSRPSSLSSPAMRVL